MSRGNRDNFDARTLEELPSQPGGYQRDIFSRICLNMIRTGYHKWGFVIYRCTYDDGELWNRYLAQLKQSCHEELVKGRRAELLEKYLDWVIIEDRDKLQCLETVIQFQEADTGDRFFRSRLPPMVITVIDRCWTSDRTQGNVTMNDGGYPAIDGCDRKYVGWEYFNTVFVASVYNDLHGELDDYESYQRPPAIYPLGKKSMPS
ncbi:hypothetical protein CCHR01_11436 [Colletotrichum chrysophilum]|uniref:Uncharacterized protein n=1 Tax=Colletotrichum chrysophilum TaxID=1836956 RepID=A0AAD9AI04_9PEZI|nr:hypothetical protein CCHR01_11436 [Colletotrichum chrysophilum]